MLSTRTIDSGFEGHSVWWPSWTNHCQFFVAVFFFEWNTVTCTPLVTFSLSRSKFQRTFHHPHEVCTRGNISALWQGWLHFADALWWLQSQPHVTMQVVPSLFLLGAYRLGFEQWLWFYTKWSSRQHLPSRMQKPAHSMNLLRCRR